MTNKKGVTILELVISVAMLSIVVVLMYGLINNLQRKQNDVDSVSENVIKISEIEREVHETIMGYANYGSSKSIKKARIKLYKDAASIDLGFEGLISVNYTNKDTRITFGEQTWRLKNTKCRVSDISKLDNNTKTALVAIACNNKKENTISYIKLPIYLPNSKDFSNDCTNSKTAYCFDTQDILQSINNKYCKIEKINSKNLSEEEKANEIAKLSISDKEEIIEGIMDQFGISRSDAETDFSEYYFGYYGGGERANKVFLGNVSGSVGPSSLVLSGDNTSIMAFVATLNGDSFIDQNNNQKYEIELSNDSYKIVEPIRDTDSYSFKLQRIGDKHKPFDIVTVYAIGPNGCRIVLGDINIVNVSYSICDLEANIDKKVIKSGNSLNLEIMSPVSDDYPVVELKAKDSACNGVYAITSNNDLKPLEALTSDISQISNEAFTISTSDVNAPSACDYQVLVKPKNSDCVINAGNITVLKQDVTEEVLCNNITLTNNNESGVKLVTETPMTSATNGSVTLKFENNFDKDIPYTITVSNPDNYVDVVSGSLSGYIPANATNYSHTVTFKSKYETATDSNRDTDVTFTVTLSGDNNVTCQKPATTSEMNVKYIVPHERQAPTITKPTIAMSNQFEKIKSTATVTDDTAIKKIEINVMNGTTVAYSKVYTVASNNQTEEEPFVFTCTDENKECTITMNSSKNAKAVHPPTSARDITTLTETYSYKIYTRVKATDTYDQTSDWRSSNELTSEKWFYSITLNGDKLSKSCSSGVGTSSDGAYYASYLTSATCTYSGQTGQYKQNWVYNFLQNDSNETYCKSSYVPPSVTGCTSTNKCTYKRSGLTKSSIGIIKANQNHGYTTGTLTISENNNNSDLSFSADGIMSDHTKCHSKDN